MKHETGFYKHILFYLVAFTSSCTDIEKNNSHADVPISSIIKGKQLAEKHCQSCHLFPEPSHSNSKTWETGILPQMGPRLGIFYYNKKNYPSYKYDINLSDSFYPSRPLITNEEWQHIINYYTATSPDTLSAEQDRQHKIKNHLSQFSPFFPSFNPLKSATCFAKIDTSNHRLPIIISDAVKHTIYRFHPNLAIEDSIKTTGPVPDIEMQKERWLSCDAGILNPNNEKRGKAYFIYPGRRLPDSTFLFSQLQRPVQITSADLNSDGKEDYVVCEFGHLEGALSWMENTGNKKFIRHVLRPFPGAIKTYVLDYNHDDLLDLWTLFTQGEEGIFVFTNKGKGQFTQQQVLRFPPIYGSSYFELADFNKDGHFDILYTCGDNADYSTFLKPFHGVYIYMNDGNNHFTKKYFFPINGCYKAIARDYDNDGDLDIAAISYFADYQRQPEEGFVYLENKNNDDFLPYSLPEAQLGRWLTMDAGDFDGDGFTDLILGNFSAAPSFIQPNVDWKKSPPFLVLKNNGKR